jgi:hypothetical protein
MIKPAKWTAKIENSPEGQFLLTCAIAKKRRLEFKRKFPNVISVGAGYALKAGQGGFIKEVCLLFYVKKKRSGIMKGRIPEQVVAYFIDSDGKRSRCYIPTDVIETRSFGLEHLGMTGSKIGIEVEGNTSIGYGLFSGMICALVVNTLIPEFCFVLGCDHVFRLSKYNDMCAPATPLRGTILDNGIRLSGGQFAGILYNDDRYVDVAVSLVTGEEQPDYKLKGRYWFFEVGTDEDFFNGECYLLKPDGREVRIHPLQITWDHLPKFSCNGYENTRTMEMAYIYNLGTETTAEGYSGAPIYTKDHKLVGMHLGKTFYLKSDGVEEIAPVAIPASILFGREIIPGFNLRLWGP